MKRLILPFAFLLMLSACGDVSSAQKTKITELCRAKLNLPKEICECIGARAQEELMEEERAMLIAMIDGDKKKAEDLRGSMSVPGMMKAGMFMAMAPGECTKEKAE